MAHLTKINKRHQSPFPQSEGILFPGQNSSVERSLYSTCPRATLGFDFPSLPNGGENAFFDILLKNLRKVDILKTNMLQN